MAYATREEVRGQVKDDVLNAIIGDAFIESPASREELAAPIIDEAIADANGEIDGYLAKRYPVPLQKPPKIINKCCKDIAVYNLFARIGIQEGSEEQIVLKRYEQAIKFLAMVSEGKAALDMGSGGGSSGSTGGNGPGTFAMTSSPRLFSRESMRGM